MEDCADSDFVQTLGVDTAGSNLAIDDGSGTVHFLATQRKQLNYLAFAYDPVVRVADPADIIRQYTEHTTRYYAKVNMSLAADSPTLQEHGPYIKQLRASIGKCSGGILPYDTLYRGVDLSPMELERMEALGSFYIPSFTSTSVDRGKAYDKSALFVIRATHTTNQACLITPELSRYFNDEKEVLLACYSAYQLMRVESVGKTKVLSLFLDDYLSTLSHIT